MNTDKLPTDPQQRQRAEFDAMFERHCILLEHLGRLIGRHEHGGTVPVAELRDVVDRDIARTLRSTWGGGAR